MAQADLNVANQSGSAFRSDLNNQLLALGTLMSGASEPSTTYAYMLWADTTAGQLKQRNAANSGWIVLGTLGSANLGLLPSGGTLTAALGSAATPGVTFTGDTDTGLYSPGTNQVALGTTGPQRLAIASSGRVLVGPGAARLVGGAVVATLSVETLGQAASFVRNSADTSGGILAIGKSRGTAAGDVTAVQNGDILGELRFVGANGTDMTSVGAHIRATVDGEVGTAGDTSDMPTSLVFSTAPDGAGSATERGRITSTGFFKASDNGTYFGATTAAHEFRTSSTHVAGIISHATSTSYSDALHYWVCGRAASSAYNFLVTTSGYGGVADDEFKLTGDGNGLCDGSWTGGGADYAEYFEWNDGNIDEDDRRGISVVLDGDKIRPAIAGEDPIGVISGNPSVVGDAAWNKWSGKYLRDEFGTYILEDYEVEDEDGNTVVQQRRKLNPAYDPAVEYVSREQRPEWDCVGLLGKLRLRKGQPTGSRWIKMRDINDFIEEWLVR